MGLQSEKDPDVRHDGDGWGEGLGLSVSPTPCIDGGPGPGPGPWTDQGHPSPLTRGSVLDPRYVFPLLSGPQIAW